MTGYTWFLQWFETLECAEVRDVDGRLSIQMRPESISDAMRAAWLGGERACASARVSMNSGYHTTGVLQPANSQTSNGSADGNRSRI